MTGQQTFVIVGAGLAGAKTAEALRGEGFDGRIALLGEEVERPYERPPLSKDYLQGRSEKEKIYVHPAGFYAEHDIEWQAGARVSTIDPAGHQVSCERGDPISYHKLLLATGASARPLPVPGADPHRVFTLRRVEDCEQLKASWKTAARVVIVGAGWIGLEVAAAARAAGLDVTVLETARLPLLRVLGPELAELFATLHRDHGVDLRLGVNVTEIAGDDPRRANGVRLADGSHVDADLVVVGVGAAPNTALAQAAGLHVDNGIVVDEHLRSTDPDIYAAGDVANAYHPTLGKHIRIEHWANALNQPTTAAKAMLGGDAVYDRTPYFYSDQYQLGMEYSGYVEPDGYDEVVIRGDKNRLTFVAFWLKDRRVLAGMNVNVWDVTDAVQSLIRSGVQVDTARLADSDTPLTDLGADASARWDPAVAIAR